MSGLRGIENEREYSGLLSEVLPRVIHTEEANIRLTAALEMLLRHLMESNGLRQMDLAKSHIEGLSQRFDVSPELFFERASRDER